MIEIDMKLPSCCDECFAFDDYGDCPYCRISQDQRGYTFNTRENRMPSCPLKDAEPRVLTIEEVKAYPTNKALWFECKTIIPVLPDCRAEQQYENKLGVEVLDMLYDFPLWYDSYNLAYKFGWRCWSSRPTDEQREAVPWTE